MPLEIATLTLTPKMELLIKKTCSFLNSKFEKFKKCFLSAFSNP